MKSAPAFDTVVGKSHAVGTKVELRKADDTPVGVLPVEDGAVAASAGWGLDVWGAELLVAGLEWAPTKASDPLSGLSGHYVSIQRAAHPYGEQETWVEVARLWPVETTVTLSRREGELRVRCSSAGALVERANGLDFAPLPGETCQQMAVRVLTRHLPYTPTILDTSLAVNAPTDYLAENTTPERVVLDLMALANARCYFDALGRIVIRAAVPSLDSGVTEDRLVAFDLDVTRYQISIGRDAIANYVQVKFDGPGDTEVFGEAWIGSGPLDRQGPAGWISYLERREIEATQVQAETYAASILAATKQGWCTVEIEAVQDPRLEPWDVFRARYLDRELLHRCISIRLDLRTDAMQVTARTALDTTTPATVTTRAAQQKAHAGPLDDPATTRPGNPHGNPHGGAP